MMTRRALTIIAGTLVLAATCRATEAQNKDTKIMLPLEAAKLRAHWRDLDDRQAGHVIIRNMHGIVRATHKYFDKHSSLPPAVVPNPELSPEKRLSGFVLLLPHLDVEYLQKGKKGDRIFDPALSGMAKKLFESIDLKKAWDDPANLKAARTVVPVFLAPGGSRFHDKKGYAVSHFAFVRGANGKDDGAFNETVGITFLKGRNTIADGTVGTFALGQIHEELGPWIAAGFSTARHVYHPSDGFTDPTFGSRYDGGCYFVNCDSYAYFLDIDKAPAKSLHALATRAGGEIIPRLMRYRTAAEWKLKR